MMARRLRQAGSPVGRIESSEPGHQVTVVRVTGGRRVVQRLAALGVVPGARLTVMRPSGPALVRLGQARIALGPGALEAIDIERIA